MNDDGTGTDTGTNVELEQAIACGITPFKSIEKPIIFTV